MPSLHCINSQHPIELHQHLTLTIPIINIQWINNDNNNGKIVLSLYFIIFYLLLYIMLYII